MGIKQRWHICNIIGACLQVLAAAQNTTRVFFVSHATKLWMPHRMSRNTFINQGSPNFQRGDTSEITGSLWAKLDDF
jgi:hypothetical protein